MIGGLPYVGKSSNIEQRYKQHKVAFEARTQPKKLQQAYDLHKDAVMSILESIIPDKDNLAKREAYWIKKLNSINNGWNEQPTTITTKEYTYEEQKAIQAFSMLVDKANETDICMATGLTPKMIQAIRLGTNYGWLAIEFPEEYATLLAQRKSAGYSKNYKNF